MYTVIPADTRGHNTFDWLDARHSFSFGHYYDPARMGFGPLRVINEDRVKGGGGFPAHPHDNMEIITIVLEGALAHRDSLGNGAVIAPGEVQMMRAGRGIRHSEFNASQTDPVHLLQIWLMPNVHNAEPAYQQRRFDVLDPTAPAVDGWQSLVVPATLDDGAKPDALRILQDAHLKAARLDVGQKLRIDTDPARRYWLQVMDGHVHVRLPDGESVTLGQGDAVSLENDAHGADIEGALSDQAKQARVLLFDMVR
jgi:hypothetical protein